MNKAELMAFEEEIADLFNQGKIPYPIHLESGNEYQLFDVFSQIQKKDWLFGSWRMHLKALLKGVPRTVLRDAILRGESISLCFPQYRIMSSAIVGGIIPIAMGTAMGIKRQGGSERVHCFLGDMTGYTGAFHESRQYARNHGLPIRWIIEDNGKSVMTETAVAWGGLMDWSGDDIVVYQYQTKWPHSGAGKRV